MSEPLRYILVGTGVTGAHWVKSTLPRLAAAGLALPVAAVDTNLERLESLRQTLSLPLEHCYTDPIEACEKRRADFAILAVPTAQQERMIEMALTYDLNVFSDPPIADSFEGALRIYAKVRKSKKKMAVGMAQRYDQDKQTLQKLLRLNRYGRMHYMVFRFTDNNRRVPQWGRYRHEMRDPLMIEAAFQHLDVIRSLCDANARTVYAATWNPEWGEYRGDSTGLVTMEMENGVHVLYEGAKANASTLNGWNNEYIRAECENGTIELDRRQIKVYSNVAYDTPKTEYFPLLMDRSSWASDWVMEMFCEWLRGGPEPTVRLKENVRSSAMLFATIESARKGKPVEVREYLHRHIGGDAD